MITPSFSLTATERVLPKLALDFTTAILDSRVTFTRTTDATHPATYINSNGYITAATNNQPRFDYNPVTLACKGLLIEESITNLLTYSVPDAGVPTGWSVGFATGSYTHTLVTGSPLLVNQNMIKNEQTVSGRSPLSKSVTLSATTTYTLTVYIDKTLTTATGDIVSVTNFTGATFATTYFKSKTDADSNGRIQITFTTAADATGTINMGIGATANDTGIVVIGGWQLEAGAFATSYIPTTSAALTRNADVATMTGTNFSSWYNATEGTFIAQVDSASQRTGAYPAYFGVNDGTGNNAMGAYQAQTNGTTAEALVSGSATAAFGATAYVNNTVIKIGFGYKLDNFGLAISGGNTLTDTSGAVPTVDRLQLGGHRTGNSLGTGHIYKFFYYPQKLTSNEIRAFSKL